MVLDDGSMYYQYFAGLPADERLGAFFTPWVGEAGSLSGDATWVQDLRFYGEPLVTPGLEAASHPQDEHPVSCAVMAIKDRKLDSAQIGVELTLLPTDSYHRLRDGLPHATFVDASPVLSRLRAIKSPEEVARMRVVTRATERSVQIAYDLVRDGSTELEFEHVLKVALAKERMGCHWTHVAFGPKGVADIMARDTAARPGDPLRVDVGGAHRG